MSEAIAIVGGGPVGSLLALGLALRDIPAVVYEARADPRLGVGQAGRSINLTLAERGWNAMREVGVEAAVEAISLPLRGRMIHSEDGQSRYHPYTSDGDAIFSCSRAMLSNLLVGLAAEHPNITVHFEHRCLGADLERRVLRFERPHGGVVEVTSTRVFAADGAFSTVRRSLFAQPGFQFFQRLSPLMYKELRVPQTADGTFAFDPEALHLWPRGECMVVAFPNVDRTFTVSMFMPAHGEDSFAALADPPSLERFLEVTCPDLRRASRTIVGDWFAVPPAMLVSGGCHPWIHEDWLALIGDAAHVLVPFLGQGLNAGFEDCSVLLDCIDRFADDWQKVVEQYQEARSANCAAVIELAESHYEELARAARDPLFLVRKALEDKVHRLGPDRFVPLYSMVAFENRPYLEVAQARDRQAQLLDRLMARPDIASCWDGPDVERTIRRELAALEVQDAGTSGRPPPVVAS
jgi:kynurenine 3-monooxygenase